MTLTVPVVIIAHIRMRERAVPMKKALSIITRKEGK